MPSNKMWEAFYDKGNELNIVPYTEVFSFLAKNCGHNSKGKKLLEIGCGAGNNLMFAKWAFGFNIYGIDQSKAVIELVRKRFQKKNLSYEVLEQGNMDDLKFENEFFDVVVDRAAIQHNTFLDAKRIVSEVYRVLKYGGLFYSSLSSDCHPLFNNHLGDGNYHEDRIGMWHFFSKSEILDLFSCFEIIQWYHTTRLDLPDNKITNGGYHLEMKKNYRYQEVMDVYF